MRTIVFAAETLNLAEVTRMIEIARAAKGTVRAVFVSYDGAKRNHRFIEREGFEVRSLAPQMGEADVQRFWRADRLETVRPFFTADHVRARVRSELALYDELRPAAVVTGFCLSTAVSARVARVPLVWINQSTWFVEYMQALSTWPDAYDLPVTRLLPDRLRDRLGKRLVPLGFWSWSAVFSQVAREHGLPAFRGSELLEGDYNLLAEPPDFSGFPVPARVAARTRYVGPLIARLPLEVPAAVRALPRDRPIVYFAMGSSGIDATVIQILRAFDGKPFRVVAPVGELLGRNRVEPPENVVVTDWLPAHEVNPMADVSVIHGGIGTVFTACLAGTPIVGVGNGNPEQESNLDCVVRKGFGVRLRKRRLTPQDLVAAIERLLSDAGAKARAEAFRRSCEAWDGPRNAARFLEETFAG